MSFILHDVSHFHSNESGAKKKIPSNWRISPLHLVSNENGSVSLAAEKTNTSIAILSSKGKNSTHTHIYCTYIQFHIVDCCKKSHLVKCFWMLFAVRYIPFNRWWHCMGANSLHFFLFLPFNRMCLTFHLVLFFFQTILIAFALQLNTSCSQLGAMWIIYEIQIIVCIRLPNGTHKHTKMCKRIKWVRRACVCVWCKYYVSRVLILSMWRKKNECVTIKYVRTHEAN